jgi:hypothetical protein
VDFSLSCITLANHKSQGEPDVPYLFAPRKAKLSIYIMPGYTDFSNILTRLGKHTKGKSCLYLNKLADADTAVLEELIRAGLADLKTHWPVHAT